MCFSKPLFFLKQKIAFQGGSIYLQLFRHKWHVQFSITLSVSENYWPTIKTIVGCMLTFKQRITTTTKLPYLEDTRLWTTPPNSLDRMSLYLCCGLTFSMKCFTFLPYIICMDMIMEAQISHLIGDDQTPAQPTIVRRSEIQLQSFPRQWWGNK